MAEVKETGETDGLSGLRGWGVCELLKRRSSSAGLVEKVEGYLGSINVESLPHLAEHAMGCWNHLISDLDREEANLEHVRRQSRDVFFSVLEALVLIEERGNGDHGPAAQRLFNAVINDLYAFEPVADVAAELWGGQGYGRLSDLLCAGVAGLFEGRVPEVRVEEPDPVEEFVTVDAFLLRSAGRALSPTQLAEALAGVASWYVKWAAQVVRLAVAGPELRLTTWEGAQDLTSRAFDGWQVRLGHARYVQVAKFAGGLATLKLPEQIDPARLVIQVKGPGQEEWGDLFARVGAD
jgi:hypothetical protein